MRTVFFSLLIASTLPSCVTVDPDVIGSIQDRTAAICRFVPTAKTISSLISLELGTVAAIAETICKAITEPRVVSAQQPPQVSGVPVEGYFIQQR